MSFNSLRNKILSERHLLTIRNEVQFQETYKTLKFFHHNSFEPKNVASRSQTNCKSGFKKSPPFGDITSLSPTFPIFALEKDKIGDKRHSF
jgi:hypothetical protein